MMINAVMDSENFNSSERPMVSVIMPNFNCAAFISMTIESVLSQSFSDWELLIQDDCSADGSYETALKYAQKDFRIKVFRNEKNCGAAVTRNNAIAVAEGRYLAFLDSDDIWFPEKLEKQIAFMQKHNCDFSFCEYEHIDENSKSMGIRVKTCSRLTYGKMLRHCWPGCLTVMYDQKKLGKIYTPDIKKNNDHALFLKVLKVAENARGMEDCLALYRIRRKSISRNKFQMIKPYLQTVHEFEKKWLITAYFCAFTHVMIKKIRKEKRVECREYPFMQSLKSNMESRFAV